MIRRCRQSHLIDPGSHWKWKLPQAKSFCVIMAASSSSSSSAVDFPSSLYCSSDSTSAKVHPRKYGVFLNFRGKDTREGFVSFLYRAVKDRGILAYLDSVELEKGAEISTIVDAIPDSNIAVVVFSKEYASSSFCLDELVKIMECRQTTGLQLLVVFYRVNPEEVENQTGSFSGDFNNHQQSYDEQKIAKWRTALKNAAFVGGWDYNSKEIRDEAALVDKIVKDVCKKLRHIYPSDYLEGLVGMHSRVEEIESLLCIEKVNEVRCVGTWGMGGIGKTTLARAIFGKYSSHFQSSCFLPNVREASEKYGLPNLKEELLSRLLNEANKSSRISSNSSSTFLMNQLRHKKVLIVLDDVDKFEQIESLAGKHEWFGEGSRIIITSRDRQVLKNGVDSSYEAQQLVGHEALELFSLFTFKQNYPPADRLELSNRVLEHAKGLPLALKVLGLFLHDRSKKEWESALNELQETPNMEVQEVLKISYNGLDTSAKEIFLHIACFFRGEPKTDVERILDSCGFSATIGLSKLADKALIVISDSEVEMHDLLQEMGRYIVRQESVNEPGKLSRLWNPEDIRQVLEKDRGPSAIGGISLDMSRINNRVCADPTAFSKMDQVKLLRFYFPHRWYHESYSEFPKKVYCRRGLESLPKKLRYLRWDCYPLKALPSNVYSENLVELDICFSKIKRLWTGQQNLSSLTVIRVQYIERLKKMPDFSGAVNLQIVEFTNCYMLREVSPSIEYLKNLKELDLSCCEEIESIPRTKGLQSLAKLSLFFCTALKNLSKLSESIEELVLQGTGIEKVPHCSKLRSLKKLDLLGCSKLKKFPKLSTSVEELCLSHHNEPVYHLLEQSRKNPDLSRLQRLALLHWNELGNILKTNLGRLRELNLSQSSFADIGSIKDLSCLESLFIIGCTSLQSLPELPPHLKCLQATDCTGLQNVTDSKFVLVETPASLLDFSVYFTFFNCQKLNEDARRSVSSHAQQIIRIFSQEALDRLPKGVGRKDEVSFVYPGNEIPDWIDSRSTGSSITLELPPNLRDDTKFSGFVLCAIFNEEAVQLPEPTWSGGVYCECLFESNDATRNLKLDEGPWLFKSKRSETGGAHVLLWCSTRLHQAIVSSLGGEDYYKKATVQFHQYYENETSQELRGVTKCGVRLLYLGEETRKRKRPRGKRKRKRKRKRSATK